MRVCSRWDECLFELQCECACANLTRREVVKEGTGEEWKRTGHGHVDDVLVLAV